MLRQYFGIDFGTSNSAVSVCSDGPARLIVLEDGEVTLPSAVFWDADGAPPQFGRAAVAAYLRGEDGRLMRGLKSTLGSSLIEGKTQVGNRAVSFRTVLERFFGAMVGALRAEAAAQPEAVVLGRPVHFVEDDAEGDARAEAVLAAIATGLGFRQVAFQYEPIAAALQYERTVAREELVLIVDIGGGTSDVSVVRVGPDRAGQADRAADILANDGIRVGGTDFDRLLSLAKVMPHLGFLAPTKAGGVMPRHYYLDLATWHRINMLYTQRSLADLKALRFEIDRPELLDRMLRVVSGRQGHALAMAVEAAKIALSEGDATRLMIGALIGGPNPMARRDAFEAAVAAPVARVAAMLAAVVQAAGVRPDQIGTVFMTGGSSGLPLLRRVVGEVLPGVPIATGDMLGSVGTGLALEARRRFS